MAAGSTCCWELKRYLKPPSVQRVGNMVFYEGADLLGQYKRGLLAFVVSSKTAGHVVVERKESRSGGCSAQFLCANVRLNRSRGTHSRIETGGAVGVVIMFCRIEIDTGRKLKVVSVDSIHDPNDPRLTSYRKWAKQGRVGRAWDKLSAAF